MKDQETIRRTEPQLPQGWFATAAGGVIGTIAAGFAGVFVSSVYADSQQTDGFEGLGMIIVGTVVAGFLGAIGGAAAALKLFHHSRPVASGINFAVLTVITILTLGSVGQLIIPEELHDNIGALLLFTLSPCVGAIISRSIFARSGARNF